MAQYMLLLHMAPNYNADLPREQMLAMTKRYMAWADALRQKGRMVGGEKLAAGGGRHIRVKDGKPVVSDGPYAEAKEVLGGYWMIQVKSREEAIEWASRCPGSDNEVIEVRQVQEFGDFPADVQEAAAGFSEMQAKSGQRSGS